MEAWSTVGLWNHAFLLGMSQSSMGGCVQSFYIMFVELWATMCVYSLSEARQDIENDWWGCGAAF